MSHYHAVVWLDHAQARVFSFTPKDVEEVHIPSHPHHRQVHHKAGAIGSGRADEDREFFADIASSLAQTGEVLVVGPGSAKLEFIRYLHRHDPALEAKLVSVETVDHPTDGQILTYARNCFRAIDRMRPQRA